MGELTTFPVSINVAGKAIVIVGGGAEALRKARLAAKTCARVLIVSQQVVASVRAFGASIANVEIRERAFAEDDLDGAALVFVADNGPDGENAITAANRLGVPLNVVDQPRRCGFFTPAIVDRAPLIVAISSDGTAPVLARLVRAKIEALLSPNLGALARLAGTLRDRVGALIADGAGRRRFYEALVSSPDVERAVASGMPEGRRAALKLLDAHAGSARNDGVVWLIGAGPGAEDLLTLRAQRLLQEADVIVHDGLVPEAVVAMGRRDADRIAVGKAKGAHSVSQSRINALLIDLARTGKKVARLKSGDPMIFGRAGEELAALRAAGIEHSIVPGVTAALAAAADSATPVTLRGVASGFVVATAHAADDAEITHWAALARQGLTLGIYMGKSVAAGVAAKLIAEGLDGATPIGIAVNAGRTGRSLYAGTLAGLAFETLDLADGPALILVGEAVAEGDWSAALSLADREHAALLGRVA